MSKEGQKTETLAKTFDYDRRKVQIKRELKKQRHLEGEKRKRDGEIENGKFPHWGNLNEQEKGVAKKWMMVRHDGISFSLCSTHIHTLFLSYMLTLTHIPSLTRTQNLSLSPSPSTSFPLSLTHTLPLSLSHTHSLSLSLSNALYALTHTYATTYY